MYRLLLTLITCILSMSLHAAPFYISRITTEEGLSNGYIMGITQDRNGFIWFATESGLNRYDGRQFRTYKKENSQSTTTSISGNELNRVYADRFQDIIWIATQRDGLNAFNTITEEFTHYIHNDESTTSLITNDVTDVTNSHNGNLWVTTYWRGFDYLDIATGTFTHYHTGTLPELASDNIWSVAENSKGLLFLGHVNDGLTIFDPATKKTRNYRNNEADSRSIPGNQVYKVFIDRDDNLWVGTDRGLALFHHDSELFTRFRHNPMNPGSLISNNVYDIMQDHTGRLWIATENGGVSILDMHQEWFSSPGDVTFTNIYPGTTYNTLSNKSVRSIFQDHFGNVWIGTYGDGVNFISYRDTPFRLINRLSPEYSLSDDIVMAISSDEQGRLWVGTDNSGIDLLQEKDKQRNFNTENSALTDNAIIAAFRDSRNNLWFGSYSGDVTRWIASIGRLEGMGNRIASDVRCFAENDRREILIGNGKGIEIYDHTGNWVRSYSRREGTLREDQVRSIVLDSNANIWVGSFGDCLTIYDREMNELRHFTINQQFPSNRVNHMIRDNDGNIWIATGNGLVLFKPEGKGEKFEILNSEQGLNDTHIRAIAADKRGNVWVSTLSGISMFNIEKQRFYNYDSAYGVPMGDFMSGAVTTTADGMIHFGSHYGLCSFHPEEVTSEIKPSPVIVTDFFLHRGDEINDSELRLPVMPKIRLSHNDNSFKVAFGVPDKSLSDLMAYSYKLEGLDERWYDTHGDNSIVFRNLPPGDYTLYIRAMIPNQVWEENMTQMSIKVNPPFWATWWAKLIYLLLTAVVLLFIIRFYKQRLLLENSLILEKQDHDREQRLNTERMRFFTNITHELRTPLTLILGPLGDLREDKSLTTAQNKKISLIQKSADRLLSQINTILEFRKTESQNKQLVVRHANLETLIRDAGYKYHELNSNENTSIHTVIEEGDYHLWLDPEIVSTIVENLLSNAMKFCDEGSITLSLYHVEEAGVPFTEIAVSDTGVGIDPEILPRIFDRYYRDKQYNYRMGTGIGLALVHSLVKLHEGEIFAESKPGKGSTFRFRLRNENSYPHAVHESETGDEQQQMIKQQQETAVNGEEERSAAGARLKILVVEDNIDILEYIEEALSDTYTVYTAADGKKGLEKARRVMPDLVISDIMMPEMDGVEMMKQMKDDLRTSHIPIILLTAKSSIEDRTEAYETGAESFITKPFSARLLHSRISNLLETRQQLIDKVRLTANIADKAEILATSLSALDSEFIQKLEKVINAHLENEKLEVNFIADKMNMSHSTLYRKVKVITGMSVNGLVRKLRVQRAEKLLLTGEHTISAVSMMVGFNSNANFRKCFREEFGLAPSEYLKQMSKTEKK